jgi:hypothetical protein
MNQAVIDRLVEMAHSPIYNYIVPGLESWLIMDNGDAGKIRMFHSTRDQQEFITPHSHRFDFSAHVVCGEVENTLWVPDSRDPEYQDSDFYAQSNLMYLDTPGSYAKDTVGAKRYTPYAEKYKAGRWYSMKADQIHSIKFARATRVLFFEGPALTTMTHVLEPLVRGVPVPTMKTEPWMFVKE